MEQCLTSMKYLAKVISEVMKENQPNTCKKRKIC